jgi:hypothetical protein
VVTLIPRPVTLNVFFMADDELSKQIEDLKMIISLEEENYKTALQQQVNFNSLKQMRENIRKLKADLQVLLDQHSVKKTGELPPADEA